MGNGVIFLLIRRIISTEVSDLKFISWAIVASIKK